jgi:hypothetical protein
MSSFVKNIALSAAFLAALTTTANAQQKEKSFNSWTVYTTELGGKKTAYIGSHPSNQDGTFKKRDEPYFLVTCVGKGVEVSGSPGYTMPENSEMNIAIGEQKFLLFTKGELAWAYDSKQDDAMIAAMKKGNNLIASAASVKNSASKDTYSLKGFTAAFNHMKALCK